MPSHRPRATCFAIAVPRSLAALAFALVAGCSGSSNEAAPDGGVDASGADTGVGPDGGETGDGGEVGEVGVSQVVDASGGTVTYDGVTIDIPSGALDDPTPITISKSTDPSPTGTTPLSAVYHFGPDGLKFRLPITVTIPYAGGADDAVIYWSNDTGGWDQSGVIGQVAPDAVTTWEMHFSKGFVDHLSKWRSTHCDSDDAGRAWRTSCSGQPGDICLDNRAAFGVQYVFVLMMENHSFDNYFGRFQAYLKNKGYSDDRTKDGGVEVPATPYELLSASQQAAEDAKTDICTYDAKKDAPYNPAKAGTSGCQKFYWRHAKGDGEQCVSDTCHEWWCAHLEVDNGRMDGFFQANDGYWEGGEPDVGKGPYAKSPPTIPANWYDRSKTPDFATDGSLLRGDRAMIYYDETDIPFYYWLADSFGLGDHYHSSVIGPTFVNRDYLYGATSRGLTSNSSNDYGNSCLNLTSPPYQYAKNVKANPSAVTYKNWTTTPLNTIYDDCDIRGVPYTEWVRNRYSYVSAVARYGAWYGGSAAAADKHKYTYDPVTGSPTNDGFESYVKAENKALLAAIAKGKDPATIGPQGKIFPVNFIDPDPTEDVNGEDEHPPGTPQMGQRLTYDVVRVLMSNPEVWKRSVLFITWDEHGGFYDHVNPPPACPPDNIGPTFTGAYGGGTHTPFSDGTSTARQGSTAVDASDSLYAGKFDQYGVRVPILVISPWAKHHYVSQYTYDHTSILRFIEARFGMPAITGRDANADAMLDFFDFGNARLKLSGKVPGWGNEALPSDAVYNDAALLSNSTDKFHLQANSTCRGFYPASTAFSACGELGMFTYGAWDWSRGAAPPAKPACGSATGCCAPTTCPLNYKFCNSDCKCEMAFMCPAGDFALGGCECCAAFDTLDPLTCIACDSKSDVFATYCPGG